jgi:hypothetical protein
MKPEKKRRYYERDNKREESAGIEKRFKWILQ